MKEHSETNEKPAWRAARNRISEFHGEIRDKLIDALEDVFVSDPLELVNIVYDCEKKFAAWAGFPFAVGVNSGTSALIVALHALGVQPDDEVITVANSDMADTNALAAVGAVPVFCDVKESDYTMDPAKVEPLITNKTRVIIPVDLYGNPADIVELRKITDKYGIRILEDAALGVFSEDYGQKAGYFADAVVFSTSTTKLINSLGYGGFVCGRDENLEKACRLLTEYGIDRSLGADDPFCGIKYHSENGLNVKMNAADAAVVRWKLGLYDGFKNRRKQVMKWYEQYLQGIPNIVLPEFRSSSVPCLREYVVRVVSPENRDPELRNPLCADLLKNRIQCTVAFTPCFHKRVIAQGKVYRGTENIPVSEMLDGQILSLPCDVSVTEDDVIFIADVIRRFMSDVHLQELVNQRELI